MKKQSSSNYDPARLDHTVTNREAFTAADLARLETESFVSKVEFHRQLDSTNNRGLQLAGQLELAVPTLVLAGEQSRGRGRGSNSWWSNQGALTFSVIIERSAYRPRQTDNWTKVSLAIGVAVCQALKDLLPDCQPGIKWPNDVYVAGRKVCGILVEIHPIMRSRYVIGVGINVNNSFHHAPDGLAAKANSLKCLAGRQLPLIDVLLQVLSHLHDALENLLADDTQLIQRHRGLCLLSGRPVRISTGRGYLEGVCQGIDPRGALVVLTDRGPVSCISGVVESLS